MVERPGQSASEYSESSKKKAELATSVRDLYEKAGDLEEGEERKFQLIESDGTRIDTVVRRYGGGIMVEFKTKKKRNKAKALPPGPMDLPEVEPREVPKRPNAMEPGPMDLPEVEPYEEEQSTSVGPYMEFPFDIPEQEPGDEEWGSLEKWHPFWKKAKSIIEKMKEHAKQADSSPGSLVKEGPFKALLDELDALVEQVRIKGDKNRVYQWIEKNSEIVTKEGKKCELRCVGPFGLFLYDVDGWAMKEVEMKRRQGYKNFLIPGEEPN